MLQSASCPNCKSFFPLGAGGWKVKLPPYRVKCSHCGLLLKTDFFYRATWTSGLVFKVLFYLSIPLIIVAYFQGLAEEPDPQKWLLICAVGWVVAIFFAWFVSFLAYLPVQMVLEVVMKLIPQKDEDEGREVVTQKK